MALGFTASFGTTRTRADQHSCYTDESLEGSWAVVGTYAANVAKSFGERTIGEAGNFTGTFVLNAPVVGSPTGARVISTGTQVGVYAINCDGTGTITRTVTSSTGVVAQQIDDFIVTKAIVKDGRRIATTLEDAQRVPSALIPGGIFLTRVQTRQPGGEEHER
jgi:hypothetical protein